MRRAWLLGAVGASCGCAGTFAPRQVPVDGASADVLAPLAEPLRETRGPMRVESGPIRGAQAPVVVRVRGRERVDSRAAVAPQRAAGTCEVAADMPPPWRRAPDPEFALRGQVVCDGKPVGWSVTCNWNLRYHGTRFIVEAAAWPGGPPDAAPDASTDTDRDGTFVLSVPRAGEYLVTVRPRDLGEFAAAEAPVRATTGGPAVTIAVHRVP